MTAMLTYNLPLLAGAPNGIKKLRELILELAVRGKLVPQDPSDEPAGELLKRITEEKARLVAKGEIKKQKPLATISEEEKPFALPMQWAWTRLGSIASLENGDRSSNYPNKSQLVDSGIPFINAGHLQNGLVDLQSMNFITRDCYDRLRAGKVQDGDILFCLRGSLGKSAIVRGVSEGAIASSLVIVRMTYSFSNEYLMGYFYSPLAFEMVKRFDNGTAQPNLSAADLNRFLVPLPPLAEQNRIAAKVDELMALCDRLEAQQADGERAHAQLVQALLNSLTQASDSTDFATNWQRLAEHFHTLFTTEPSIDALKQTLLQLAVMGKLVQQDPNDEPATELLKRIAVEKTRLVAENKLKKQKALTQIGEDEIAFKLPQGWQWVRKAEVFNFLNGYAFKSEWFQQEGVRLLRNVNVSHGVVNWKEAACISEEQAADFHGFSLKENDVVLTLDRPIISTGLKYAVIRNTDLPCLLLQRVAKIAPYADAVSIRYLSTWLNSCFFVDTIDPGRSNGVPHISTSQVASMPFALPPLPEQHRIVTKIDQLMTLCDQLKTRLSQARQLNEQLASTLVERALTEDSQQKAIAADRQVVRTLLAAEVTHQLHSQRTFGQRKLQKVIYLAEHAARLAAIQGDYLRDAAGPHDRQLMNKVESELQNHQWYERIERETVGHAYRPLSQAGQHRQAYSSAWSVTERATVDQVIELMRDWDTDRCEMTVTLYAAWNDFILEGRPVTDEAIVDEVMHSWNDTKLRFGKIEWLAVLAEMKKHKILMPTGFGKRTRGGMLSLPGFE
ncbi:restriction endonuclease subunit S [Pseudomonas chlororaphis]|uniref:restriction endonuclease subunit S n=1 Tax=Pseudomonas chlororaphis TaxID=587753 RepID=UPI0023677666|nr:restriction endonuclease subunit S [Pseudomonas chlororaphis]WDG80457.1 restriction endonuclease subunit S [Pseudomonas chlororaphis]WDG86489.1 restriction endonuclease subunit S [Pseudomonas chlororaphis]